MDPIELLIKGMKEGDRFAPYASAETMLGDLKEGAKLFDAPCPFEVGDIITPRKGVNKRGRGLPMMVVKLHEERKEIIEYGRPAEMSDMVTCAILGGHLTYFFEDSKDFEFFDPERVGR